MAEKADFFKERDLKKDETNIILEKEGNEESKNKNEINTVNPDITDNTELSKKDRKKLVKQENKERREQKKKMKEEFKSEKLRIQKNISNANKVMRVGLSVKEL